MAKRRLGDDAPQAAEMPWKCAKCCKVNRGGSQGTKERDGKAEEEATGEEGRTPRPSSSRPVQ